MVWNSFNPRGPCGPRRLLCFEHGVITAFQSSRSLRTATELRLWISRLETVSILAVLADRDQDGLEVCRAQLAVSILAVLADRDSLTLSYSDSIDVSILAVLADRDLASKPQERYLLVSILAVLADRDQIRKIRLSSKTRFQSSRSLRTATGLMDRGAGAGGVSILAVLADRDSSARRLR